MVEERWTDPVAASGVMLRMRVRKVLVTGRGTCFGSLVPLEIEVEDAAGRRRIQLGDGSED